MFQVSNIGECIVQKVINGVVQHYLFIYSISIIYKLLLHFLTFMLRKDNQEETVFTGMFAYATGTFSIKAAKINDIMKFLKYVPAEHTVLYSSIIQWLQDENNADEVV